MLWLYLTNETDFFTSKKKVLHMAPEQCFVTRFKKLNHEYVTADFEITLFDIIDAPYPENSKIPIITKTGDISDPKISSNLILSKPDIIFHLAALIAIPYSYRAPDSYVDTNIKGTLNICQAAKENGNIRVIHTSTSEVYGTAQYVPIDEKHPMQAQSPYSASKIASDAMAMSFYNSFDLPISIARPFNTYGPRQSARAVIPTIITQIVNGAKEIKLGDTSPTRDFNYVEDTCRGLIAIAENNVKRLAKLLILDQTSRLVLKILSNLIKELMGSDVHFSSTDAQRDEARKI